jgi:hypothetical protein
MKPEPEGAREAKRMMVGPSALAGVEDTAPGSRNALAVRRKMKREQSLVMEYPLRTYHSIANAPNGTILGLVKGKNDER